MSLLTPSQSKRASRLKQDGETLVGLAAHFGVSVGDIRRTAKRDGWETKQPGPFSRDLDSTLRSRYEKGESLKALACDMNCSVGAIRAALKRAGYKPIYARFTDEQKYMVRRMFKSGQSEANIGKALGISRASAGNLCVKLKLRERAKLFAFTEKQKRDMKRLIKKGNRHKDIAKIIGITDGYWRRVTLYLISVGLHTPAAPTLTYDESMQAKQLTADGWFLREIASELNITVCLIKKAARRDGWLDVLYPDERYKSGNFKLRMRRLADKGVTPEAWYTYTQTVRLLSRDAYKQYRSIIDPSDLRSRDWHVDHRFSVCDACVQHVDPWIVSHPANLVMLRAEVNRRKTFRSSISLDTLMSEIQVFERLHGPFVHKSKAYNIEDRVHYHVTMPPRLVSSRETIKDSRLRKTA